MNRQSLFALATATALLSVPFQMPAIASISVMPASLSGTYLAGRSAGRLKDLEAAKTYVANALRLDPDNITLVERLFQLDISSGDIPAAEELADRVVTFNSEHRLARTVLGLRDLRLGKMADARMNFETSSYTPIGELTANLLVAWTYASEKKFDAANSALRKLETNDSFSGFQAFHEALIADFLNSPARAEAAYKRAKEQAGLSLRVVEAYGSFLRRNGKTAEAQKVYQEFLDGDPENALVSHLLADAIANKPAMPFISSAQDGAGEVLFSVAAAMNDGDTAEMALIYCQLALANSDDRPVMATLLGSIYSDMDRYEDAITVYNTIPDTSDMHSNAQIEIALDEQRLGKTDAAQARLNALLKTEGRNYSGWVTLGNIHRNNSAYQSALDAYSKAIALFDSKHKENWQIFYYRGIAFERLKKWPEAEKDLRHALQISPDEATVLNYLGYSMIDMRKNLSEAIKMVQKAVELRPNDGYIVDSLGWAYYQLGEYEEATKHLERAVDLKAGDPIIAEHLGDVYWRSGRKLEAKFQWQHAKDNEPEPDDLKRIVQKLKDGMTDDPAVTPAQNGTTDGTKPSNG